VKTYRLKRTGDASLEFKGEMLGTKTSRNKQGDTRWYEATIYRTKGGCLVMQVVFHTTADAELDHYFAKVTSPDRIANDFRGYDTMTNVLGFPPGEQFAQEQRRLETELRALWIAFDVVSLISKPIPYSQSSHKPVEQA
jgi:ssRNA-specific RNase YbeY (16S rRNA maturation enzyme)